MNVAFDPWIPVVDASGRRKLASLLEVLTQGKILADLAVRPHGRVALMRLLICVAHAALDGPKDYDEWRDVPARLPDAVTAYLTDRKDLFKLFHPDKPWLQVPDIQKGPDGGVTDLGAWTPVSKLDFALSSGNNSTLLDHGGLDPARIIDLEDTVLSMLAFQCFSTGGLISQVYWQGTQSRKTSKDAPCVPASMMHAFLRGSTIGETIHLNLPTYENVRLSYGEKPIGRPVWDMMPTSYEDKPAIENATLSYLGRLVPLARLMRLNAKGQHLLLGDGLVYPSFADGFPPEPTATVVSRSEERALLSFRPERAIWRELAAIVVKRKAMGTGGPLSLDAIQENQAMDLTVSALARSQASIIDTTESVFHVPARLRSQEGTQAYEAEVKLAESLGSRLGWAVESYRADRTAAGNCRAEGRGS